MLDVRKSNWRKFEGKRKLRSGISVNKLRIGFFPLFIKDNKLESFNYLEMFYQTKKRQLVFHFTKDSLNNSRLFKNPNGNQYYRFINFNKKFLEEFNFKEKELRVYEPKKITKEKKDYYFIELGRSPNT